MARRSDIHCSQGERAWTDLVTNTTFLSRVEIREHLANLVKLGAFPTTLFSPFLHEAVHHWCFHSPVGSALALLQMRARRRALVTTRSDGSIFDVVEDLIRYEAAVELMRPLAEGLSLYAEFDAMPQDNSQHISPPFMWLNFCFNDPEHILSHEVNTDETKASPLYKLIFSFRLSDTYIKRKANVLLSAMSCSEGGYLAGYLTVKNLWGYACSRVADFSDTEMFLMFLRAFFYEDFGLVAELLEPSTSEIESVNRIVTYLQDRFAKFVQLDLPAELTEFQRNLDRQKVGQINPELIRLRTEKQLWELGKDRLQTLVSELEKEADSSEAFGLLANVDLWTLAQRDIMWIGSSEASIRISETGRVVASHGENVLCAGPGLTGVEPGEGDGCIDVYYSLSGGYKAVAVSIGQKMVLLFTPGMSDETLFDQFKGYRTNRAQVDSAQQALHELVEMLTSQHAAMVLVDHVRASTTTMVDEIYGGRALLWVPEESVAEYLGIMKDDGFLPILENDVTLVRRLAQVSLAASLSASWDGLIELFDKKGLDLEKVVADLDRCSEKHSIPLLVRQGKVLLSMV